MSDKQLAKFKTVLDKPEKNGDGTMSHEEIIGTVKIITREQKQRMKNDCRLFFAKLGRTSRTRLTSSF